MVWRRMLAATAAIACVGGMAMAAVAPGVAHASPAGRETAASSDGLLPPHVFAPYYFNTADTLAATSKASGAKYLTLAFLQTAKPGSCTVDWNGDPSMPVGKTYAAGIAAVQAAGGSKWSAATQIDSSALTGVSCPDTTFCVAVDARGDAVRWNGARWSTPAGVDAAGFAGVSCASHAFCAAVAGNGIAVVTKDGARRWAPVLADSTGGGLTAVSCFTGGCVAVDFAGNAFGLRNR